MPRAGAAAGGRGLRRVRALGLPHLALPRAPRLPAGRRERALERVARVNEGLRDVRSQAGPRVAVGIAAPRVHRGRGQGEDRRARRETRDLVDALERIQVL